MSNSSAATVWGAATPQRILLVRTSAMGDIVHCLPFLSALRRLVPKAEIGWVVEKVWSPILEGHPDIHRLIPVRAKAWRKKPWSAPIRAEIGQALAEIRSFRADLTFDLMGNHKGGFLARASRADRIIGASESCRRERSSARWMKETVDTKAVQPGVHAVDQALALLASLTGEDGLHEAIREVSFEGHKLLTRRPPEADAFFEAQSRSGRPLVLIQAGAGWANKMYPLQWWGEVARNLDEQGFDVWLPGAPGEFHWAELIVELSDGAARTVDATDFHLLAALLRGASLLIGGDTGPVHLAHALGTPVLSIIGPTDPNRNGPYRALDHVLFHPLPCSYCYKRFDGPRACLLSIPPKQVTEKALEILRRQEGRSSRFGSPVS